MDCNELLKVLDKRTWEELYTLLYKSEKTLSPPLINLLSFMERECFSHYSIDEMKEMTREKSD